MSWMERASRRWWAWTSQLKEDLDEPEKDLDEPEEEPGAASGDQRIGGGGP
jgi:hypothetical protein